MLDVSQPPDMNLFAVAVGGMPLDIAAQICRAIKGLEALPSIAEIATLSRVSEQWLLERIRKAGEETQPERTEPETESEQTDKK